MTVRNAMVVALCLCLASVASGQKQQLESGDAAPGLDIEEFVAGSVAALEPGKVYLLVFWETTSAPSKKALPMLADWQARHEDEGLSIIAISDEAAGIVKSYVGSQGSKIKYVVAVDRRNATKRAWFDAAQQKGYPSGFIVDRKGRIAHIGHPLDEEFERILVKVLMGRFDPMLNEQAEPILRIAKKNRQVRNWRMAFKYYDEVLALDKSVFADVALDRFEMMLVDMDDVEGAYKYADELLTSYSDDAALLAVLAKKVVTDPNIPDEKRNMDFALTAAQACAAAANPRDPESLAVQALVHFHAGNYDEAIGLQRKAYFLAVPDRKPKYKRVLMTYQETAGRASLDRE